VDDAVSEIRLARDLDPASASIAYDVGQILFWARRYGEAVEELHRAIEMEPEAAHGHAQLAEVLLATGDARAARAELARAHVSDAQRNWLEVAALAASGDAGPARRLLASLEADAGYVATHAEALASLHAMLGDADGAMPHLERALAERHFALVFLGVLRPYDPVRADPRFQAVLRRIGIAAS
jgi:tetratricopeptide (TPR) repeat protein